jgi:integrase
MGDIDHNGRFLTVHRSIDSIANKVLKPKNDHERRVNLRDELSAELVRLRQELQEFLHGIEDIPEWVFVNEIGGWNRPDQLRKGPYQWCLEKAGLRPLTLHDLRHSFASLLLTAGTPIAYISEQMGHASIELTVKRYGHLTPSANRHHINNLAGLSAAKIAGKA